MIAAAIIELAPVLCATSNGVEGPALLIYSSTIWSSFGIALSNELLRFILIGKFLSRAVQTRGMTNELGRKSVHAVGVIFILLSYFIPRHFFLVLLLAALLVTAAHCAMMPVLSKIPIIRKISAFFNSLTRKEEQKKGIYIGATTYLLSMLIIAFFFNLQIFRAASLLLAIGDSASTIFGIRFGRHKLPYNKKKSIEGSLAGFAAALVSTSLVLNFPLAAIASAVGMLVESLPWKLDDNLTVPIATALVLWLLI